MFKFEAPVIIYLVMLVFGVLNVINKHGKTEDLSNLNVLSDFQKRFGVLIMLSIFTGIQLGIFAWGGFFETIAWPQMTYFGFLAFTYGWALVWKIPTEIKNDWKRTTIRLLDFASMAVLLYFGGFFTY